MNILENKPRMLESLIVHYVVFFCTVSWWEDSYGLPYQEYCHSLLNRTAFIMFYNLYAFDTLLNILDAIRVT